METEESSRKFDSIVERIASKKPQLTRAQILEMVEEKMKEAESLLNREGAAFLVATDLGVPLIEENLATRVEIEDIVPNLSDVTVLGRVLLIYPVKGFLMPDGSKGKLQRVFIGDDTGMLEVYLWNDKAEDVARQGIVQNSLVRVEHAYSRRSLTGKTELHVRERGEITLLSDEASGGNVPPLKKFFKEIGELRKEMKEFNVAGRVVRTYPVKHFTRADGEGKVMRFTIADDTGRVNVVVWNEKVDEASVVQVGDRVEVMRGTVKENMVGEQEIHVNRRTQISILPSVSGEAPPPFSAEKAALAQITPGMRGLTVEGFILEKPKLREVTLKDGSKVKVADLRLRDETGEIKVSAWRELAEKLSAFSPGTRVRLKNVNSKVGLDGKVELTTGGFTAVELLSSPAEENP